METTEQPVEVVTPPFEAFDSIPRLSRTMVVTEKIDGTNAQITILEDGRVLAGSRNRWITPTQDNFGFARWVSENEAALREGLGIGTHYGEWWGAGIQRRYGLDHKRFSLFNTNRWKSPMNEGQSLSDSSCYQCPIVHVVPLLVVHTFDTNIVDGVLAVLARDGSRAAPGFMNPEGVVVYHAKSDTLYKKTLDGNDGHKSGAVSQPNG